MDSPELAKSPEKRRVDTAVKCGNSGACRGLCDVHARAEQRSGAVTSTRRLLRIRQCGSNPHQAHSELADETYTVRP
jgi:hypothetical protein